MPRPASDGCISSREATFAAASALAVEAPISMLPLSAEVEVISSREAAVSLAGLQREHGSSYVLRWFEEGNPSIFDQVLGVYRSSRDLGPVNGDICNSFLFLSWVAHSIRSNHAVRIVFFWHPCAVCLLP